MSCVLCAFYLCFKMVSSLSLYKARNSFCKSHESCVVVPGTPGYGEDLQLAGLGNPNTFFLEE